MNTFATERTIAGFLEDERTQKLNHFGGLCFFVVFRAEEPQQGSSYLPLVPMPGGARLMRRLA